MRYIQMFLTLCMAQNATQLGIILIQSQRGVATMLQECGKRLTAIGLNNKIISITIKRIIMETTLPNDVMNQISDITESILKEKNIYYSRSGTKFQVKQKNVMELLAAQAEANNRLIKSGVITEEMLSKEVSNVLSSL